MTPAANKPREWFVRVSVLDENNNPRFTGAKDKVKVIDSAAYAKAIAALKEIACMCKDDDGVLLYEGSVADDCLRQLGEIE